MWKSQLFLIIQRLYTFFTVWQTRFLHVGKQGYHALLSTFVLSPSWGKWTFRGVLSPVWSFFIHTHDTGLSTFLSTMHPDTTLRNLILPD